MDPRPTKDRRGLAPGGEHLAGSLLLVIALLTLAGCVRFSSAQGDPGQGALDRAATTISGRANGAMTEAAKLLAEGKPFPAMGLLGDEMDSFLANPPERCYAVAWGRLVMAMQTASLAADFWRRATLDGDDAALGLMPVFTASLDAQADDIETLTTDCAAGPSGADGPVDAATNIEAILGIGQDTLELTADQVRQHDHAAASASFSEEIGVLLANPPERCFAELWGRVLLTFQTGLVLADLSQQASAAGFELSTDLAPVFTGPIDEHTTAIQTVATPC